MTAIHRLENNVKTMWEIQKQICHSFIMMLFTLTLSKTALYLQFKRMLKKLHGYAVN